MPPTPAFILVDILVAAVLLYAALESHRGWKLLRRSGRPGANYWRLAALGLVYLALDEFIGLHEGIGRTISWAGAPAPWHTSHWDDVVLAGYVVLAGAISLWYLQELRRTPRVFALLALGFAITALAVLLDNVIQSPTNAIGRREAVEEFAELAGAVVIGLGVRARHLEAIGVVAAHPPAPFARTRDAGAASR